MTNAWVKTLVAVFVVSALCVGVSLAQVSTATLSGQVLDSSGSSVAGANVQVVNKGTGVSRDVKTDEAGRYVITALDPGIYDITVEQQGFEKGVVTGITLAVAQQANQDIILTLGQVSQVVSVEGSAAVIETDQSSVGTVVSNQEVENLPLNQRTFYSLALLSPATYQPAQNSNLSFRGGFSVAGSSEGANSFILNGVDDNDNVVNVPDLRPSVEAIQEFNLVTGVAPAEYGRSAGGHVNTITKSGTNEFHGDAFEFIRNAVTDARNYFDTAPTPKIGTQRNQYGGTFGGPVIRNKTFFFVNYEGMGLAQGVTQLTTVPTTAMVNGDFRSLLSLPKPIHVVNPFTGQNFPTPNVIPANLMSTLGKEFAALYPAPTNSTVGSTGPASNYLLNENRIENLKLIGVKVDHRISDNDSIVGNFNYQNDPSFEPSNAKCGVATIPLFGCYQNDQAILALIGETHIFNSHLLNDIRFGYVRVYQQYWGQESIVLKDFPALPNSYSGFPYAYNAGPPYTTVSGMANLGSGSFNPQVHWGDKYDLVDILSWTRGAHTFKFGGDLQLFRSTELFISYGRGGLVYNSANSASVKAPTSGYSFADLLLGVPYQTIQNPTSPTYHPAINSSYFFGQDDWRVRPNLTLNLGLRYEYFGPPYDPHDNVSIFNETTQTFNVAGQNGFDRGIYARDLTNFAPRIGLAWQPFKQGNTVIRAAGGIFYNSPPVGLGPSTSLFTQVPFRVATTYTNSAAAPLSDSNPYVAADSAQGIAPATIDRNYLTARVYEWSFGVEQKLTSALGFTIDYVGSHGSHLLSETNDNQAVPTTVNGVTSCCTRPFPKFGNITHFHTEGDSSFNGLETKLQQTYHNGLTLLLSYTYGHSIDSGTDGFVSSQSSNALPQNSFNLRAERGSSDFDVRHRVVFSPVYELPFGKNKPFLNAGDLASKFAGGWQVSTITSIQSGRPFTVYNSSSNNSGSLNNQDRPNVSGNPNNGPKTVAEWFNTSVFSAPASHTFGNEGRNIVLGPGFVEIDAAIQRQFQITERVGMYFRAEVFNLPNHPNFLNPLASSTGEFGSGAFGQITAANDPREMQFAVKILF